jgi:hypothetical protein
MAATESVRLPKVIVKTMRELALKEGRTITGQIVFLINMALKQKS